MSEERRKKVRRRGRRKKKNNIVSNIVLVIALAVFGVSVFRLYGYYSEYKEGTDEYEEVEALALEEGEPGGGFRVNFEELLGINPETVGWLRFYPQPEIINYPIVHTTDNDKYLHTTFAGTANASGAIFLNTGNSGDFLDKNSIIYGHRMRNGSMFRHLEDYKDQTFWEANPRFYIYTPDGWEMTYQIYSAGVVEADSELYRIGFGETEEYEEYLRLTKSIAGYDTGIEVGVTDDVVVLSTCVSNNDDLRYVVIGVKEKEVMLD